MRAVEHTMERVATKTLARWPRVGGVPYQALLLRFLAYKIHARKKKVRKGEGGPRDEARRSAGVKIGHDHVRTKSGRVAPYISCPCITLY